MIEMNAYKKAYIGPHTKRKGSIFRYFSRSVLHTHPDHPAYYASIKNMERFYLTDIFSTMVAMSLRYSFPLLCVGFFLINCMFSFLFWIEDREKCLDGMNLGFSSTAEFERLTILVFLLKRPNS